MQHLNRTGVRMIPPPLAVRPELTVEDVRWLNEHLSMTSNPPVRYARALPPPPPPPAGYKPPPTDVGWIEMEGVRR